MSARDLPRPAAIALDVDGVLTDNTVLWGERGEELRRFSYADVMGIARARREGVVFALISGEENAVAARFAAKLGIEQVFLGCKDKASALRSFAERTGVALADVCFVGNDLNDVEAMRIAGLSAAPADAHKSALAVAALVSSKRGGDGAVREIIDELVLDRTERGP